jgi:hypothetical protein
VDTIQRLGITKISNRRRRQPESAIASGIGRRLCAEDQNSSASNSLQVFMPSLCREINLNFIINMVPMLPGCVPSLR